MEIFISILLLIVGLILIIKGGDWFVDASVQIAKKTGVSEIVIGATIVSIGTTLPELLVSLIAVISGVNSPAEAKGFTEIAVNNAVGSMFCNIGLILSVVLMCTKIKTDGRSFVEKAIYLLATTIILIAFALTGNTIVIWEAVILLLMFVSFMVLNLMDAKRQKKLGTYTPDANTEDKPIWWVILFFILGAAGIAGGAELLVKYGEKLAILAGIPAQIIGVTVIAIGTSLPELVTGVTAVKKGSAHLSMGNVIGANIINSTLLLGLASTISGQGLPIDIVTSKITLWFLLAVTVLTIVPSLIFKKTSKWQGLIILLTYLSFIVVNILIVVGVIAL